MKRVLCLILVLVFCLSMACPAFATDSPGHGGDIGGGDQPAGPGTGTGVGNPKTGDVIMMWVTVMLIALIALVAAVVVFRKKFA